ncbi:hypothetical protein PYCCODRAFT_349018 [Trametes coccinea BRFM310]|uniref:Uncharacterized protein n=1 Tax=Trametes coccinea (strain BRFM310) TaxID=1353009 RepID=A0A1Y2J6B7_TRAC3|nr:hypothetical protein PYCCODRAFT_349018 [Trametes coccinea BRFM310]
MSFAGASGARNNWRSGLWSWGAEQRATTADGHSQPLDSIAATRKPPPRDIPHRRLPQASSAQPHSHSLPTARIDPSIDKLPRACGPSTISPPVPSSFERPFHLNAQKLGTPETSALSRIPLPLWLTAGGTGPGLNHLANLKRTSEMKGKGSSAPTPQFAAEFERAGSCDSPEPHADRKVARAHHADRYCHPIFASKDRGRLIISTAIFGHSLTVQIRIHFPSPSAPIAFPVACCSVSRESGEASCLRKPGRRRSPEQTLLVPRCT